MAAAGSRFESYVRDAMREADLSLAELARRSGVKETNWHSWFRGEHRPRPNSLILATAPLKRTPDQLLAAWDGARQRKAPAAEATGAEILAAMKELSSAIRAAVEWREDGEVRLRALEAELAVLRAASAAPRSVGRSAPPPKAE